jgi:hypothetical protein
LLKILAIKFQPAPSTRAIVAVLHPESMALVSVTLDGTVTPSWRINIWQNASTMTYKYLVDPNAMVLDKYGRVYMGVYSDYSPSYFKMFKINPDALSISLVRNWNVDILGNGTDGAYAMILYNDDLNVITGGQMLDRAYICEAKAANGARMWWL